MFFLVSLINMVSFVFSCYVYIYDFLFIFLDLVCKVRYIILVSYKVFSISYIVYIVVIGKDEPFSRFLHIQFVNFLAFLDFFCVLPFFLAVVIKSVLTNFFCLEKT